MCEKIIIAPGYYSRKYGNVTARTQTSWLYKAWPDFCSNEKNLQELSKVLQREGCYFHFWKTKITFWKFSTKVLVTETENCVTVGAIYQHNFTRAWSVFTEKMLKNLEENEKMVRLTKYFIHLCSRLQSTYCWMKSQPNRTRRRLNRRLTAVDAGLGTRDKVLVIFKLGLGLGRSCVGLHHGTFSGKRILTQFPLQLCNNQ